MAKFQRQTVHGDGSVYTGPRWLSPWAESTDDLRRARDLIVRGGWVQNTWGDWKVGRCVLGALREVNYGTTGRSMAVVRLAVAAGWAQGSGFLNDDASSFCIYHNDRVIHSQAEALGWFDRALALSE